MTTAAEKERVRSEIESEYNGQREQIEQSYLEDKNNLEEQRRKDLKMNEELKRAAFESAGLNTDGSDPQGRPTG